MSDGATSTQGLLRQSLGSFQLQYNDYWETWKALDAKAQSTATIGGIFLAAAFALARQLPPSYSALGRWGLFVAIVLLVVATCVAVVALQVRRVTAPPIGENISKHVQDLLPALTDSEREERLDAFVLDQIRMWRQTNTDMQKVTSRKACWVSAAQWTLLAAIVVATGVSVLSVIN